jgi:hypothetical protein
VHAARVLVFDPPAAELERLDCFHSSMPDKPGTCLFCASDGPRAKEHVFPDWMLRALNVTRDQVDLEHRSESGEAVSARRHDLHSFRYGHICAECNNTWLSQLETEARRIFRALWKGSGTLDAIDAYALTLWTLKTACVLNAASNYRRIIPVEHAAAVMEMAPPGGLFLHIAYRSTPYQITWHQSQTIKLAGEEALVRSAAEEWKRSGYHIALGFGPVMLRLIFIPMSGFGIGSTGKFSPTRPSFLWPTRRRVSLANKSRYEGLDQFVADAVAVSLRKTA